MAECSYARCLQERQLIKRELMKHSKEMLHIVGLERIAEELMGRRKWKYYQEALTRNHMNTDHLTASQDKTNIELKNQQESIKLDNSNISSSLTELQLKQKQQSCEENHRLQEEKSEEKPTNGDNNLSKIKTENNTDTLEETSHKNNNNNSNSLEATKLSHNTNSNITKINNLAVNTLTESPPPTPIEPIDWKPNDKCYFCVNGKLLTVNAKGELVAESGPAVPEPDHAQRLETDSNDSNESNKKTNSSTDNKILDINKLLTSQLRGLPNNMTSMGSMTAAHLALQTLSGQLYPNFNWMQLVQPTMQNNSATPTTSDTSVAAVSPSLKDSPSPSDATGEQPLDLSSKPSPNSSVSGDQKNIRTKSSRATPVPTARRTYSDEDLNNALQDILTGKLGTRKAAAQYSVPRSTLRNKVNKLTTEAKRTNAQTPVELLQLQKELEMDEKLSADEGEDSNASTPQPDAALDEITNSIERSPFLPKFSENNGADTTEAARTRDLLATNSSPQLPALPTDGIKRQTSTPLSIPQSQASPQPAPLLLDGNMLLQALLISASGRLQPQLETMTVRDLLGAISSVLSATAAGGDNNANLNNGTPNMMDQRLLLQQLQQHQLQQQQQQQQQQVTPFSQRLPKSETPETTSSMDANDVCEEQSTILKIPSFKPVAGASNTSNSAMNARVSGSPALLGNNCNNNNNANSRNGDSPHSSVSPRIASTMLAAAVVAAGGSSAASATNRQTTNMPPLMHTRSHGPTDSQSPTAITLRDVIANSIHRTMNEQANKDAHAAAAASMLGLANDVDRNSNSGNGEYKKPSISVVKNIGGTDTSRFGTAPNLLAAVGSSPHSAHQHHQPHQHLQHGPAHAHHPHHATMHMSRQDAAALAAGKGTRPKRGKYRNYDRDSLVEAVKAVQRGEMSVHRAGSYYGVPHSTLEYKVKERHLMRPRKREPKPQPGLDSTSSASTSKSNTNIPGHNNLDKMKSNAATSNSKLSNALKNNAPSTAAFPNVSAFSNGMKMSMFDPALAAQLQYTSPFWQHAPASFGQMQMDFTRNAQSGNAAAVNADLLKSLYQDEAMRAAVASGNGNSTATSANSPSPIASPMLAQSHHSLYESVNTNGASILDGIIRQSLDRKSGEVAPTNALLDQLLINKTPLPFTNNRQNEYSACGPTKRLGSPMTYGDIKRERASPMLSTDDDESASQSSPEDAMEHNNNKSKNLSGNGGLNATDCSMRQRQLRSRMTSRDSDGSSLKSELMSLNQNYNNNSNSKMTIELNGSAGLKTELGEEVNNTNATSILQEKLAQIKAERENEENL